MAEKCSKEVELGKIQSDIEYIKKAIAGNGEKGLMKDTRTNTDFRLKFESYNRFKNWLLGSTITVLTGACGYLLSYIIHGSG